MNWNIARTFGIWVTGLIAAGSGGALLERLVYQSYDNVGGAIAGALAFACLRLWMSERRELDLVP